MKFLDYIFFKFNQLILFNKSDDSTVINSYIGLAFLFTCNIFSLLMMLGMKLSIEKAVLILFVVIGVSYRLFIYKERWKEVKKRFLKDDPFPVFGKLFVILYSIVSVLLVVYFAHQVRVSGLAYLTSVFS